MSTAPVHMQERLSAVLAALPASLQPLARITQHCQPPLEDTGAGRLLTLDTPLSVAEAVARTKKHLGTRLELSTKGF